MFIVDVSSVFCYSLIEIRRKKAIAKHVRINEEIRSSTVLLIDEHGQKLGEMSTSNALALAEERNVDLVEVAPDSVPPVCKLLDYGKLKYEETRAERKARANQKIIQVKEIRLGLKISTHDLDLKINQAQKFLEKGNKVHFALKMRGREQAFPERAFEMMQNILASMGATVEQAPNKLGNQITATVAPIKK